MNIRVFILIALFAALLLQAGTADAIIVKNASSVWNTTSEIMPEGINASPRIIAEYSNSIFRSDLETPGDITASPRIIAKQSNSIWRTTFAFPIRLFNDTESPVITNVTSSNITDNSATITWDTDEIANSLVKYGTASGIYTEAKDKSSLVKVHTIELTGLSPGTRYYFVVNSADQSGNLIESSEYNFTTAGTSKVFDTNTPSNPYPSISGTHNGTITPNKTITVSTTLYTYPCPGTGGHSEYIKIWNGSGWNVTANWNGYEGDWHNISFDTSPFTLEGRETYNYSIRTGSYPQIHHDTDNNLSTPCGFITCSEFIDANGKRHSGWIPAIKLG